MLRVATGNNCESNNTGSNVIQQYEDPKHGLCINKQNSENMITQCIKNITQFASMYICSVMMVIVF